MHRAVLNPRRYAKAIDWGESPVANLRKVMANRSAALNAWLAF